MVERAEAARGEFEPLASQFWRAQAGVLPRLSSTSKGGRSVPPQRQKGLIRKAPGRSPARPPQVRPVVTYLPQPDFRRSGPPAGLAGLVDVSQSPDTWPAPGSALVPPTRAEPPNRHSSSSAQPHPPLPANPQAPLLLPGGGGLRVGQTVLPESVISPSGGGKAASLTNGES